MPNHPATVKPLALAMALCAIAPAAASARFDLNPPARTTSSPQPAVQVIRVSAPGGFDWGDAGIGAGVALGLSMLAIGGGLVIADRRGGRPARPIRDMTQQPMKEVPGIQSSPGLGIEIAVRPPGGSRMTHARIHHRVIGIPAIVVAATLALGSATAPASARTFNFNSAGSMVQQPLPPQWGCIMRRLLSGQAGKIECRESRVTTRQRSARRSLRP